MNLSQEFQDAAHCYQESKEDLFDLARREILTLVRSEHAWATQAEFVLEECDLHSVVVSGAGEEFSITEDSALFEGLLSCWEALCDTSGDMVEELDLDEVERVG